MCLYSFRTAAEDAAAAGGVAAEQLGERSSTTCIQLINIHVHHVRDTVREESLFCFWSVVMSQMIVVSLFCFWYIKYYCLKVFWHNSEQQTYFIDGNQIL